MQTFAEIIAAWGDDALFAADVGVSRSLVACWKHRNSIPLTSWTATIAAAERRGISGVTLDLLHRLASQRRGAETEAA